ncbi:hypothetical protein GUITHDRAFT_115230 [Guillardia theta CCMP2712]|uniref:D-glutamate cyclase-like C-terminal domain-containing protein n=1 Tax=Guillardia theta (strain CCMP2712) TaxID=905079 RepID=L1IRF6_GUITC|nr:hypothetical protein GUITHDRAFT_115230 [Guillardia theta CCMP2712]EKX38682.1 hypothetical protein GUITHDRAFT_115230 [Guillardia theta CCMP2712]|eukprot:XP_005825662.1 hypothetical protein GUITHDRAFT_115230 [Guillardia theta CCMP2712]
MATRLQRLEEAAAEDKGGRGIGPLLREGELEEATRSLQHVRAVAILTGYPCCSSSPPTETDGPPGALAIARALMRMGKRVMLMTDEINREPIVAAEEEGRRSYGCDPVPVLSFPGGSVNAQELVESLELDCLIAIERAGPAEDGGYYTMRGRDMSLSVPIAKLESLFACTSKDGKSLVTIGVGDGGNEVGMGKRIKLVRAHVPLGDKIACTVKADHLIVAGVSNWGGWALALALMISQQSHTDPHVLSLDGEKRILQAMIAAGARDGVTSSDQLSVDGMPWETHEELLKTMLSIASDEEEMKDRGG